MAAVIAEFGGNSTPVLYLRQNGQIEEARLDPDALDEYDTPSYRHDIQLLLDR